MSRRRAHPEQRSAEAAKYRRWYKSREWKRLRAGQLERHPMCQCPHCRERGKVANTVHHRRPHKGNRKLFFDPKNLTSFNKHCHDGPAQSAERGGAGFAKGCDERGLPLDPDHHWNRELRSTR